MRKILLFITLIVFSFTAADAFAGVRSIVESSSHTQRTPIKNTYTPNFRNCQSLGYSMTSCPSQQQAVEYCPTSSNYFKYCCPKGFIHKAHECRELGRKPSGKACHGYHMCE